MPRGYFRFCGTTTGVLGALASAARRVASARSTNCSRARRRSSTRCLCGLDAPRQALGRWHPEKGSMPVPRAWGFTAAVIATIPLLPCKGSQIHPALPRPPQRPSRWRRRPLRPRIDTRTFRVPSPRRPRQAGPTCACSCQYRPPPSKCRRCPVGPLLAPSMRPQPYTVLALQARRRTPHLPQSSHRWP